MAHDNKDDDEFEDKQGESKKMHVCPRQVKNDREKWNKYDEGKEGR